MKDVIMMWFLLFAYVIWLERVANIKKVGNPVTNEKTELKGTAIRFV